jgi:phenylpropionate dioxygenase-like ring-hydroxylating dioxygenase large terminal subunit
VTQAARLLDIERYPTEDAMTIVDLGRRSPAYDPGDFYQHVLDTDTRPVPEQLRRRNPLVGGPTQVPVERYLSREAHELEVERIWKRVWQMACREEEIPEVGDTYVYEIASLTYIVVRVAPDVVKAYPNACLHRGRQLVDCDSRVARFRCAFHGFTWELDGTLGGVPSAWDFPQITDPEAWRLPEVPVGRWGGFVFINPDPGAAPFEEFLGDLPSHFERAPLEERYIAAHAAKVLPANWKAAQEAFMESFHVLAVHPQLLPQSANSDTQYDAWGNYARAMGPNLLPSGFLSHIPSEQEMLDAMLDKRVDQERVAVVPEGTTARAHAAEMSRSALRAVIGADADGFCDAEMADSFYFTLFPNLHPWAAFNRICFRFRPYGSDPDRSVQEVYLLQPYEGERPKPATLRWLTEDEDWTAATEIGPYLARILNQDVFNMEPCTRGMKASATKVLQFSAYQESKIRHFHQLWEDWTGRP